MRAMMLTIGVLLAGCGLPSPTMLNSQQGVAEVEGSRFSVRWTEDRAEATRTNVEMRPRMDKLLPRARQAIEQVTGCTVVEGTLAGDPTLIRAGLDCPG
jgi:hypothetical protein